MAEIEGEEGSPDSAATHRATEASEGQNGKTESGDGETTTPPASPPRPLKRKREPNPNADALRDVARFRLADDPPPTTSRRREKLTERWYYTKPRYVGQARRVVSRLKS